MLRMTFYCYDNTDFLHGIIYFNFHNLNTNLTYIKNEKQNFGKVKGEML